MVGENPRSLAAALLALMVLGPGLVLASIGGGARSTDEPEPFSPLFARRLEVGLESLDRPAERTHLARMSLEVIDDPVAGGPLSAQPLSFCLASACYTSGCLGSACVISGCLGSACGTSTCLGSGCLGSICGGSACIGSTCVGSVCVGSSCVASVCTKCTK